MIVARCRDVANGGPTRWLVVTRWGSFHLPRLGRRQPVDRILGEFEKIMDGHSEEWQRIYMDRLRWYARHQGDMTGAPQFPEGLN